MIAIEAIKFNHDDNSATHDALNIRKNATQFVHVPEWRRFIPQGLVIEIVEFANRQIWSHDIHCTGKGPAHDGCSR